MKYQPLYLIISASVIVPGAISLLAFGLKPGLDFTGGSRLELEINAASISAQVKPQAPAAYAREIRNYFESEKIDFEELRETPTGFLLKTREIDESRKNAIVSDISREIVPVAEQSFETLGPILGRELLFKTIVGILLAALFIAGFIIYQFKDWAFGLCATLATIHDTLVILGVFSLLGKFAQVEVDTLFVTAVLTVLSFSVHDTIVVYDRIREKMSRQGYRFAEASSSQLTQIIDAATNETLVRSLNNSLTVIFMLTALFVLGGVSIRYFALALLVGTVSGTYSSPFVASPLLVLLKRVQIWRDRRPSPPK